ncbi:hypothetical protein HBI56_039060 [Parastagonospora nodorum]|uniref:Uncharacterized protein n=1 Tax=Phaeosphaeria nodorum (strain SN15 / ATCC MYA-4574 / FGSC 10173) TaxID=321614 RepID=A0A7U2EV54_PHANO|nr:hypothetical protein HBH56_067730 [Parastagonospora nodorum]QRC93452.1 hypothetical protein JI435_429280 [Parastagonospora nodorum SN15]KAH3932460.1 hypothetical protein HBH54_080380 [Parastagonospora nodorum]KAH3954951.1 hypothetical protein HBH53_014030 [Parastagonospora nodorum]KAH3986353.1 hypothetical protein HBH52_045210 [Parastagonospora nodorum]
MRSVPSFWRWDLLADITMSKNASADSHDGLMGQSTKASVNIDVDLPTNCPIVPRRTNPPRSQCSPMRRAAHAYSMLGQSTAELSCPDLLSAAMILLIRCSVHIMGTFVAMVMNVGRQRSHSEVGTD